MSIISASRRTDIPAMYSEWFIKRLKAGEAFARNNPYRPEQVQRYTWKKEDIDCIVFWTKNAAPMLRNGTLAELEGYPHYFQFTLNAYGKDLEPNLPTIADRIDTFRSLWFKSVEMQKKAYPVVWRYDPIIFTQKYTKEWHLAMFEQLAVKMAGFTERCVISFANFYAHVSDNMNKHGIRAYTGNIADMPELHEFCGQLAEIAKRQGITVYSCAESIDLSSVGILHGACIDKSLVERFAGFEINAGKSKSQRTECGCIDSIDFGTYNTCSHGCNYCYACKDRSKTAERIRVYDVNSPILCDTLSSSDKIFEHKLSSLRKPEELEQLSLF